MAFTFTTLKTAIQDYSQSTESTFVTHLDDFIKIIEKTGKALKNRDETKQIALNTLASFPAKYLDDKNKLMEIIEALEEILSAEHNT